MKSLKTFITIILCITICVFSAMPAFAAATPIITISNESAKPGQEVTVDVTISNNPGIMAMAFSIKYDNTQFEFIDVTKGFISAPTYKDHADKGYISFSVSETADKKNDGNIMSLKFKIKDSATPGKYAVNLCNSNYEKYGSKTDNCFSDSKENLIVPKITAGSIKVEGECDISGHTLGEWEITKQASCYETGLKVRTCSRCGFSEQLIMGIFHTPEEEWTVDKAATPTENGIMSRHCTICGEHLDEIYFSYEEVEDSKNNEENSSSTSSSSQSAEQSSNPSTSNTTSENKKPPINNTEGAKNPLSAVEDLQDYKDKYVQQPLVEQGPEPEIEAKGNSVLSVLFTSILGIVLIILAGILVIVTLVLVIILIIVKKKKSK